MRSPVLFVLGSLPLLTGCVTVTEKVTESPALHDLTDAEKQRIKADLLVALKVPDALFSTVRAAVSAPGQMTVCGWIRLRSDFLEFPKYPYNKPFVVTYSYSKERLKDFRLVHFADTTSEVTPPYARCLGLGIPL